MAEAADMLEQMGALPESEREKQLEITARSQLVFAMVSRAYPDFHNGENSDQEDPPPADFRPQRQVTLNLD